ncbi:MAG: hypothetical protein JJT96_01260 [Opitutales bacterium]|nr:hypothetical protein [Opitutales bacterium]
MNTCFKAIGGLGLLTSLLSPHTLLATDWQITPADGADFRTGAAWDTEFVNRLAGVAESRTWSVRNGNQSADAGKGSWSPLLAEVWKKMDNPAAVLSEHAGRADALFRSSGAGSFGRAFSVPGYTRYYFQFRDHPTVPLPADTAVFAHNRATSATSFTRFLSRPDRFYDTLYQPSLFNSENFNWMMHFGGLIWAFEVDDFPMGTHPDNPGVDRGGSREFYTSYINNLTRALFHTGRVEWNSNNYWVHSFTSVLNLYDFAPTEQMRRQAQAIADWMLTEAALHHMDGAYGGADVRAKSNAYRPFAGGIWSAIYAYFVDADNLPTYDPATLEPDFYNDLIGYLMWSNYRPPQVLLDIARRNFALPVEIQSAKPFYYLDVNRYADWRGDTEMSRRFEFETLYLDDNYLLSSLATYRPDRAAWIPSQSGFFTEQSLWRIVAKGSDNGGIQVTGNSGFSFFRDTAGRNPREQIGQYANVMMRVIGPHPSSVQSVFKNVPAQAERQVVGNDLYVDVGQGVYFAVLSENTGAPVEETYNPGTHVRYVWPVAAGQHAALVLEVGTEAAHGSFAAFKAAIQAGKGAGHFSRPATDRFRYVSTADRVLEMEYVPPGTLLLNPGNWADSPRVWNTAGVPARVWRDGAEVDFHTWDSYRVVEGEPIIHQTWGSGILRLTAGGEGMEIRVDPETADVAYFHLSASAASPGFADWAGDLPEGQRGPEDAPFGDGISNLLRFALGGSTAGENIASHLPRLEQAGDVWRIHYTRRAGFENITLQHSPDMVSWESFTEADALAIETIPLGPREAVTATLPDPLPTPRFLRLKTTLP